MAIGDLYRVIDHQSFDGQEVLNVYHYVQTDGAGAADELLTAFNEDMIPSIRAVQNTSLTHTLLEAINLDNDADFGSMALTSSNAGTRAGESLPVFTCWAFRYNRATRAVRNGQKRICGPNEGDQSGGDAISAMLTPLNALAGAMEDPVTETVTSSSWKPVIVRTTGTSAPFTYTSFDISSVQYVRISTQNTRKRGRGA